MLRELIVAVSTHSSSRLLRVSYIHQLSITTFRRLTCERVALLAAGGGRRGDSSSSKCASRIRKPLRPAAWPSSSRAQQQRQQPGTSSFPSRCMSCVSSPPLPPSPPPLPPPRPAAAHPPLV